LAFIVTLQVEAVPEHAPDHAENLSPGFGKALRLTTVPAAKRCEQSALHEMPDGELVTVPAP
jgi:hypothetical protein